jgi:membrane associated rhomboid family serine protease
MPQARYSTGRSYYHGYFPTGVKWLLISNTAMFLLMWLGGSTFRGDFRLLGLMPQTVVHNYTIWQFVTYLFLHADIWHLLFNMLSLWMFGSMLERDWGTRQFLKYYFLCGIGAGICDVAVNLALNNNTRTIGASGAIYGLLLAYGVLYPNQTVLMNFLFPIKAKYMVMIYGAIALLTLRENTGVSNLAHLGGMIFGFVYLKTRMRLRLVSAGSGFSLENLQRRYRNWKVQRAKRKFQVYMKKHGGGDRDRWVN